MGAGEVKCSEPQVGSGHVRKELVSYLWLATFGNTNNVLFHRTYSSDTHTFINMTRHDKVPGNLASKTPTQDSILGVTAEESMRLLIKVFICIACTGQNIVFVQTNP